MSKLHEPAFISNGDTSGGDGCIGGEFYKQVASSAENSLAGQVFHLVGVVYRRRVNVVPILNQQPETWTKMGNLPTFLTRRAKGRIEPL